MKYAFMLFKCIGRRNSEINFRGGYSLGSLITYIWDGPLVSCIYTARRRRLNIGQEYAGQRHYEKRTGSKYHRKAR